MLHNFTLLTLPVLVPHKKQGLLNSSPNQIVFYCPYTLEMPVSCLGKRGGQHQRSWQTQDVLEH